MATSDGARSVKRLGIRAAGTAVAVRAHKGRARNQTFLWRVVAKQTSGVKSERLATVVMSNLPLRSPTAPPQPPQKI